MALKGWCEELLDKGTRHFVRLVVKTGACGNMLCDAAWIFKKN